MGIGAGVRNLYRSPSSRRAWIEIIEGEAVREEVDVALLAEGVDRNRYFDMEHGHEIPGRPPRGGRG